MPAHGRCWIDTSLPVPLTWNHGVVQLGHHSYSATKDCSSNCLNSWHWDDVTIAPAVPLGLVPTKPRWATATVVRPSVALQRPAPTEPCSDSPAVGTIAVSFDGGRTYTPAVRKSLGRHAAEQFSSYLQPIPAGTTTITFSGLPDRYVLKWMVANINVVSPAGG